MTRIFFSLRHLPRLLVSRYGTLLLLLLSGCEASSDVGHDDDSVEPSPEPFYCADSGESESASTSAWAVEGPHYRLYAETTEAEARAMSAMLEAAWDALESWFDAAPSMAEGERLTVSFYATEAAWAEAIIADGLAVPTGAGGFYHPTTETAYLYQQPTLYFSRQLLLHEVIHQFHHLARLEGHSAPGWYMEGHAEYLSHYDWDGECLRLGQLPQLTQEDTSARALAALDGLDLASHFASDESVSRPLEWAMFRFFDRAEDGRWSESWAGFRGAVDGGATNATLAFEDAFGEPLAYFEDGLASWVATEQQPMTPTYLEWTHVVPGVVDGESDAFTIAPVKEGISQFSLAFVPPTEGSWAGGVLVGFDDSANWSALVVDSDGRLSGFEVEAGEAWWRDWGEAPAVGDLGYVLSVSQGLDEATVRVNDEQLLIERSASAAGGPALNDASLRFTDIIWQ
jgi:hypothetical protein